MHAHTASPPMRPACAPPTRTPVPTPRTSHHAPKQRNRLNLLAPACPAPPRAPRPPCSEGGGLLASSPTRQTSPLAAVSGGPAPRPSGGASSPRRTPGERSPSPPVPDSPSVGFDGSSSSSGPSRGSGLAASTSATAGLVMTASMDDSGTRVAKARREGSPGLNLGAIELGKRGMEEPVVVAAAVAWAATGACAFRAVVSVCDGWAGGGSWEHHCPGSRLWGSGAEVSAPDLHGCLVLFNRSPNTSHL